MLPGISFVIPVLNGAQTIKGCIESVLSLSYPRNLIEIIVVDNGSTDGTVSTLEHFNEVKIILEPRRGRSFARNAGWKAARYEFIAFVDCDVVLEKQWLRYILQTFCSDKIASSQGKITPIPFKSNSKLFEKFRFYNKSVTTQSTMIETVLLHDLFPIINTASCLYRKVILEKLDGFDTTLTRAEDADLSLRASRDGYLISYSDMALSYVIWDKGEFASYLKREISNAAATVKLLRKFYDHRDSFFTNLQKYKASILNTWATKGDFPLPLIRGCFKVISFFSFMTVDFFTPPNPEARNRQGKSCVNLDFSHFRRHFILRSTIARIKKLRDPFAVSGTSSHPDSRIVISNNRVQILNTFSQYRLTYQDEQFYFLRSFILDDDEYFQMVGEEAFAATANNLMPQLFSSLFFVEKLDSSKICLNPFVVFKRLVNEDDETEGFCVNGGRAFRGTDETIMNREQPYFMPIVNYLEKLLSKEDWFSDITIDLRPEVLSWLCDQEIITDRVFFETILHQSFDLEAFLVESAEFKKNKIQNLTGSLQVSPILLSQLKADKHKFEIFKSHLKQLNNLMSLSESVYWVEPWSFHHPMPVYLTDNLKQKLLHFDRKAWSELELKDLLDAGVLVSSELQDMPIDVNHLAEQFKTTQAFYAPQATSAYLTWSMGKYLYHYFKTNLVKMGDTQCADRRAVYDSPLCLHVQDGMTKLINKVLPFKVKSSFNYSVCYYQYADLYPHKDRPEAPYSMSYTLAAYDGDQRSHYKNTLGLESEDGKKTEIELAYGDITLFNGFELTHYRHPIAENHSLYVIVMHFVREDFAGQIG